MNYETEDIFSSYFSLRFVCDFQSNSICKPTFTQEYSIPFLLGTSYEHPFNIFFLFVQLCHYGAVTHNLCRASAAFTARLAS